MGIVMLIHVGPPKNTSPVHWPWQSKGRRVVAVPSGFPWHLNSVPSLKDSRFQVFSSLFCHCWGNFSFFPLNSFPCSSFFFSAAICIISFTRTCDFLGIVGSLFPSERYNHIRQSLKYRDPWWTENFTASHEELGILSAFLPESMFFLFLF